MKLTSICFSVSYVDLDQHLRTSDWTHLDPVIRDLGQSVLNVFGPRHNSPIKTSVQIVSKDLAVTTSCSHTQLGICPFAVIDSLCEILQSSSSIASSLERLQYWSYHWL